MEFQRSRREMPALSWEENMLNRLTKLALGLALPFALLASSPVMAEIREHSLKFAAANNKGHPQVMGMEKFAELVKEKSGGKIEVKLFPGGVLGGDVQTVSALQGGVIEMTVLNAGILASNVKQFGAVDLPFLFNSGEEADKVMDGAFGTSLMKLLPDTGLVGLAYWELGFRNLTNNRHPVTKLEDIKGLKIRTIQSPIPVELFNALGANAVPLPYTELYTALETGTVDGQENPSANIINAKFYEVQKYMTLTRHQYNPQIVLVSKKFWDGLNDEEKAVLQQAAVEARDFQRKVSREQDAAALEEIRKTGMEVSELSPEETQKLRDAVKPMIEKFSADIGQETVEALFKEIGTARGQ
jgi:tripartite ATP-independent transporter DctP family solute receptor